MQVVTLQFQVMITALVEETLGKNAGEWAAKIVESKNNVKELNRQRR